MSMYLRHTASNYNLLYQPLKRLATLISSLRDFTRCGSSFTRGNAALHAAKQPYTTRQRLYTAAPAALTRAEGTLHGATRPYPCRRHLPRRRSRYLCLSWPVHLRMRRVRERKMWRRLPRRRLSQSSSREYWILVKGWFQPITL